MTIATLLAACTAGMESAGECARTLSPGDSIASALSSLADGETLCLSEGRFVLDAPLELRGLRDVTIAGAEVVFDEDAEELPAEAGTVLDFAGAGGAGAALAIADANGVTIRDLTIESPPATGVAVSGSSEVTLRRVTVVQAGAGARRTEDGIRVSESSRVRIDGAQLLGGSRAGVSFSGCRECVVERSVVLEHLAGVLVTESERCEVRESEIEINGIGVLVADLPSDPRTTRSIVVRNSLVLDSG
ncbi:MAG TPA: right-handed parallel beta-helix repeat-containing protein, partial [Sandaracinaceae bacterium]